MATARICSIPDCIKPARGRGWCTTHWARWRKHGAPLGGKAPAGSALRFIEVASRHAGDDCLIWPFTRHQNGYARAPYGLNTNYAHRAICEKVHGPAPSSSHQAAHSCGNGKGGCVSPSHLRWATPSENQMDRAEHGTSNRGTRHWNSKLTYEDVVQIRLMATKNKQKDIATLFNISRAAVCMIVNKKNWAWAP